MSVLRIVNPTEPKTPKPHPMSYDKMLKFRHTDTGNAELFAHLYRGSVLYDHKRKCWLVWAGHWWAPDQTSIVMELAKIVAQAWAAAASSIPLDQADEEDAKRRAVLRAWSAKCESRYRIKAIEEMARSFPTLADSGENWDRDPWLLGVKNGVVDLLTGKLRPGKPEDRISMCAPFDFNPLAECPRWEQFMQEIFGGDQAMVEFMQRALGYSLTGSAREQAFFLPYGDGENGKGTLFETIRYVLGPYAHAASFATFIRKDHGIPEDRAAMAGRRFITASEPNEGIHLDESLIKTLTGEDKQRARRLYENSFEYDLCGKIWLAANHLPVIQDHTHAMWRRVVLITFLQKFEEGRRDKDLRGKLQAEAEGILAWLIKGCLDWQRNGLGRPKQIDDATQQYRRDSDTLGQFIEDRCTKAIDSWVAVSELRQAYEEWCEENSIDPVKRGPFNIALQRRGYVQSWEGPQDKRARAWKGLACGSSAKLEEVIPAEIAGDEA